MTQNTDAIFQIQGQTVEQLKLFIDSLKSEKHSEYIRRIRELEEELSHLKMSKKYGIVFEEKREDFEERARNALPVLQEVESMRIHQSKDSPRNLVIEGDNYHALSCLLYTHKGKVDVIYIDPPYNTGNKDFIYNDSFVDKEDTYRHSKWLSFMKKRLVLAQELLSESGVIFISIDDNEQAQLKMLCDEVFGEGNFIECFVWNKTNTPPSLSNKSRGTVEYILCYEKVRNSNKYFGKSGINNDAPLLNKGNSRKPLRFPVGSILFNIEDGVYLPGEYGSVTLLNQITVKDRVNLNEVSISGEFKWGQKNLDIEISSGTYFLIKSMNFSIRYQKPNSQEKFVTPNKFLSPEYGIGTNEFGTKELIDVGIIGFSFPKPVSLIKFIINITSYNNPNSLILDFFAGSGTTGHAVLELNREDGGNRQFILCSNREATSEHPDKNICRDITYERVKRVATGYENSKGEHIEGLGGNIHYYQTDFIKIEKSRENLKQKFKLRCNDLIKIKENTFEEILLQKKIEGLYIYKNHSQYTVIAYDYLQINEIKTIIGGLDKRVCLYIFSISTVFSEDFEDMKDSIELKNIPEEILEVYLRIFNF